MALPVAAAPPTPASAAAPPLLPVAFGGWQQAGAPTVSTDAASADAANAAVLREYGFQRYAAASYTQPDGTLSLRAIQFADATGAYGAYTYYLRPDMTPQEIGTNAGFDGSHVLFWKGTDLVEAQFDHLTAMSAAQLRELAQNLPSPLGNGRGVPPTLPAYLPRAGIDRTTIRYAIGPLAYAQSGGVLPASLVDFDRGAEAVSARYSSRDGDGTLTILSYPTPQMAEERSKAIEALLRAGNTPQANNWPAALAQSVPVAVGVRRSGPLVVLTSGNFPQDAALRLRNQVNYQADVVWNDQTPVSEVYKAARLYLNIFILVGIIALAALLTGLFLGGGRVLYRKLRGKPLSSVSDMEFIRLNLRDDDPKQ